jgi:hypothetical protein
MRKMRGNDDPRCLCETEWVDGLGIRTTNIECPLHGVDQIDEGSEVGPVVGGVRVPMGSGPLEDDLVIVVRRRERDKTVREMQFDSNTIEKARLEGRIEEMTIRLVRADDELRAAYETLQMEDDALSLAETLLTDDEKSRSRYEAVTGRHLMAVA